MQGARVIDWQDDFPITGPFAGATSGACITSGWRSMYRYDEPTTDNTAPLILGRGYINHMRTQHAGCVTINEFTVDVTGTPHVGNFNFTPLLSRTATGWNLLGNPYPSQIKGDLTAANGWTRTNLDRAIYLWDPTINGNQGGYVSYVNGVSSDGVFAGVISSSQGFWVFANAANPQLSATEAVKTVSLDKFYRKAARENLLRLVLTDDSTQKADQVVFYFDQQATTAYDGEFDAYKYTQKYHSVSSLTNGGDNLSINGLPLTLNDTLPLPIANAPGGGYRFTAEGAAQLPVTVGVYLRDKVLDRTYNLAQTPTHSFRIAADSASFSNRFEVIFNGSLLPTGLAPPSVREPRLRVNPNPSTDRELKVGCSDLAAKEAILEIRDALGKVLHRQRVAVDHNRIETVVPVGQLPAGLYLLTVHAGKDRLQTKVVFK